jgi:N-methylhydantoinase B
VEGGSGGGLGLDGINGTDFPAAALRNVPVEILESEAPVLVHRFSLRPDSEGAGQFRGGFGIEYAFEVQHPQAVIVTRSKDRHRFSSWGAAGGRAGSTNYSHVRRPGQPDFALGKAAVYRPRLGEVIVVGGGGGGGYGDPMLRSPASVQRDVRDGLVSRKRARTVYGVVFGADLQVDAKATAALRRKAVVAVKPGVFDLGPGRTAWERDWGVAYEAISDWIQDFPSIVRREAQERAFHAVRQRLRPACTRSQTLKLLKELSHEWLKA